MRKENDMKTDVKQDPIPQDVAQKLKNQLNLLQEVNRSIGENEKVETTLMVTLHHLLHSLNYEAAHIYRLSAVGDDLWLYLELGPGTFPVTQIQGLFSLEEVNIITEAARTQKPVCVPNILEGPYSYQGLPEEMKIKSEVAIPLLFGSQKQKKLIGVLQVQSCVVDNFPKEDIEFLSHLADLLASVIQSHQTVQQLENDLQETKILYDLRGREEITKQSLIGELDTAYQYEDDFITTVNHLPDSAQLALVKEQIGVSTTQDEEKKELIVPIRLFGEMIGVLGVEDTPEDEWSQDDVNLLEEVSSQVALAIENSRLLHQTQERSKELSILFETSQQLSETIDLQHIYNTLARQIINYFNAHICTASLLNAARTHFSVVAEYRRDKYGEVIDTTKPWHHAIEELTILQQLLKEPDIIIKHLENEENLDESTIQYMADKGDKRIHSLVIFPILVRNNLVGVLEVGYYNFSRFHTENELQLAKAIISQITVAIENAQLFQKTESALAETQNLYKISRALVESDSIEDIFKVVLENVRAYDVDRVSISLLDRSQTGEIEAVTIVASWDRDEEKMLPLGTKFKANEYNLVNAFAQPPLHPLISEDLSQANQQDDRMDESFRKFMYEELQAQTMFSTPMFLGTEYKGVISISTRTSHVYSEQEIRVYQTLADQAIIAIENRRLFEVVRRERDQAALLYEMGQTLSQATTTDEVKKIVLSVTEKMRASHSEIFLTDKESFYSMASTLREESNELTEKVLSEWQENGEPKTVLTNRDETEQWQTIETLYESNENLNSTITTSFISKRSQLEGLLRLYDEDIFSQEDISLLESVAIQAAATLENIWLLHQTTAALTETEILYKTTRGFNTAQTPNELLSILVESLVETGIDRMAMGTILTFNPDQTPKELHILATWDKSTENIITNPDIRIKSSDYAFIEDLEAKTLKIFHYDDLNPTTQENIDARLGQIRTLLAAPLAVGKKWLGTLFIASRTEGFVFNKNLVNQITTLAGQVAVVLQSLQLVEETQRNLYNSQTLSSLSQELLVADTTERIYDISLSAIASTHPTRGVAIFMYDELAEGVELEMTALWNNPGQRWAPIEPGSRFSASDLGLDLLLKTGEAIISENAVKDEQFSPMLRQLLRVMQMTSLVAVPIWLNREVNGFMLIGHHTRESFPKDIVRLYGDISSQMSVALENKRLLEEAQRRATLLQSATEISQTATSNLELDKLLPQTVNLIRDRFGYYHVSIFLVDEYQRYAIIEASTGEVGEKMVATQHRVEVGGNSLVGTVASTGKPEVELDIQQDAIQIEDSLLPETSSEIALPLIARGKVIGILNVHSVKRRAFGDTEITILESMANQLANAIEAARSFEEAANSLEHVRKLNEYYLREQWGAYLKEQEAINGYRLTEDGFIEIEDESWEPEVYEAIKAKKPIFVPLPTPFSEEDEDQDQEEEPEKVNHSQPSPQLPSIKSLIAPLRLQNEAVIGMLDFMVTSDEDSLREEDKLQIIEAVSKQAAQAIDTTRLHEQTQAAREEAEALYKVGQTLVGAESEEEMFNTVLEAMLSTLGLKQGGILLFEDDKRFGRLFALYEDGQSVEPGLRFPIEGNASYDKLIETKKPLAIEDVVTDPLVESVREINLERGIASLLLVPIVINDEVIGAMGADVLGEKHAFSEWEISLASAMADQLSIMLQNHRLIEETHRHAVQLQTSADVGRAATSILDQDEMLSTVVDLIKDRFGFYHVQIFLVDAEEEHAILHKSTGEAGQRLLTLNYKVPVVSPTVVGQAISLRKPILIADIEAEGESGLSYRNEFLPESRADLAIPLLVGDKPIGALDVHSSIPHSFSQEDIATLELLAAQLAIAIQNARIFREQQETAERLKEIDKLKTQFLANMSHELRTPLNSIIGFSRVILKGIDGPLTELQKTDLTSIHHSGQHLLSLINNILDLSKIEAGKMELNFEEVEIEPIAKSVMSTAKALVKDKPVTLAQEIEDNLPILWADPTRIRQVILNLVSNACKFTEEGTVMLRAFSDKEKITVSVEDPGIGIPKEKLDSIFEEFTQVDGTTTRKVGGTGLGLPISRHFVEMHKGQIWVESAAGKGSVFSFAIPITPPDEDELEEDLILEEKSGKGKLILAIDDDHRVIDLYKRFLEKQEYRVRGLNDSTKVMEEIREHPPYAILLDVLMPDKDGWNVLRELKENAFTKHLPVIICSIINDKNRAFSLGATDYLIKPIVESELIKALHRLDSQEKEQVKVLVIDDQADDILLIRRLLEAQSNYTILEAGTGMEGLKLVTQQRPDLIILDLTMPEMDGFKVLEMLKENEETRHIPVIIVSAKDLSPDEQDFLSGQVEVMLRKGLFTESKLLEDVNQALQRIRPREVVS